MRKIGEVLHLAKSGSLIIKALGEVHQGAILVDEKGRKIGKVVETIGPVKSPYLSVTLLTDKNKKMQGSKVFLQEAQR
ncbi:MAG: hypothetical protein HYU39_02550 [Thaumarchaeota archaeon]|nr:hypothetical protein [Nitrososphaerota archaeon]